jgi:hypothetical protein
MTRKAQIEAGAKAISAIVSCSIGKIINNIKLTKTPVPNNIKSGQVKMLKIKAPLLVLAGIK